MAGVSIATVSHVVNGTGAVGDVTKQRIRLLIESTGYVPNTHAQHLTLGRSQKTKRLGSLRMEGERDASHETLSIMFKKTTPLP